MNQELPQKLQWSSKHLRDAVDEMENEIIRLRNLLDAQTGKIDTPTPYPIKAVLSQGVKAAGTPSYSSWGNNEPRPSIAIDKAKKAYEESLPLVEKNRAICAENRRIVSNLLQQIENAGIPASEKKYTGTRKKWSGGYETVPAGWKSLGNQVQTADTWGLIESDYKRFMKEAEEWQQKIDYEATKKQQDAEKERSNKEKETKRIALCLKYGVDPVNSDTSDVRDAILDKNKYLKLAHYLQRNRGDWSEGPHYAECGLDGFSIEDETDKEIYDELHSYVADWDGDGRVFRDCKWNYSVLFGMAPEELRTDYESLGSEEY